MRAVALQSTFLTVLLTLSLPFGSRADAPSPDPELAARQIVRALGPGSAGDRALVRFDPSLDHDLPEVLRRKLEAAGVDVELLAYGASESFAERLARTDIYVWLPVSEASLAYHPEQVSLLHDWLLAGRGRQIHFHWGDGTRATDGMNATHDATFDRIYSAALEIDYEALDRVQRAAEAVLRRGTVRVTTPDGTDLRFRLGDRPLTRQNGDASKRAMADALVPIQREIELPAGAIRVAPLEESVEGRLVVPWARFPSGRTEGLSLRFERGQLSGWSAAAGSEHFERELAARPALGRFRELAIGMNPKLVAPPGDERIPYYGYGEAVVRLGLGNNSELGGAVTGEGVRWLFFPAASIEVDGRQLLDSGRLVEDEPSSQ